MPLNFAWYKVMIKTYMIIFYHPIPHIDGLGQGMKRMISCFVIRIGFISSMFWYFSYVWFHEGWEIIVAFRKDERALLNFSACYSFWCLKRQSVTFCWFQWSRKWVTIILVDSITFCLWLQDYTSNSWHQNKDGKQYYIWRTLSWQKCLGLTLLQKLIWAPMKCMFRT